MPLKIRLATDADLAAAAEVTVAAYRDRGFLSGAEDGYADQLADTAGRAREAELYVAVDDGYGDVVGTVTYCPQGSPWGEVAEAGEGEFRMLSVLPAHAGRGVGRALVERCLARARELGCDAMVLSSLPTMASAHRMYEGMGFVRRPERDWSPAPAVVLWAFRKQLSYDRQS